nr:unnamed protein product [Callosobruchus analis]
MRISISKYTRVTAVSATCIDNIILNFVENSFFADVIDPCISDHKGQYLIIRNIDIPNEEHKVQARCFSENDFVNFKDALLKVDWQIHDECDDGSDSERLARFLTNTFVTLIKEHFPLRSFYRSDENPPVDWHTPKLKQMRDTLSGIKTVCEITRDFTAYNTYKNYYSHAIRIEKTIAYDSYMRESNSKAKHAWKIVNYERNKRMSSRRVIFQLINLSNISLPFFPE